MKKTYLKFINWVLALYARKVIKAHDPFVIAITGSVGKTSTKEAVYQVLHDRFGDKVRCNHGNLNSETGLPLTILGYGEEKRPSPIGWLSFLIMAYFRTLQKDYPKYLILEMGVDKPGDISYFGSIVKPDIAIITSVEGAHLGNFKSITQYQEEKISIIKEMKDGGKLVVNFDDKALRDLPFGEKSSFSLVDKKADFFAEGIKLSLGGTEYRICSPGQKIAIKSQLLGHQFIYSSLAAFAIGNIFGLQSIEIKKSLDKVKPIPGRMNLLPGRDKTWLIDDSYNANPSSVRAAFEVLSELKYDGRKIAIIGNMNELGRREKDDHISVGEFSSGKADLVVFTGPNAEVMAKTTNDKDKVLWYKNRLELEKNLDKIVRSGDLILIKASQYGNYFEEITKRLMLEPENSSKLLVRQASYWRHKKNKLNG